MASGLRIRVDWWKPKKYINGYISGKEHICFVYHTTWNLAHSNHPRLGGAWLHDKRTSEWVQTSWEKHSMVYIYMMPCLALLFQHQIQTLSSVLSLEKHLSDPQCVALRHMVDGSEACELSGLFSKPQAWQAHRSSLKSPDQVEDHMLSADLLCY